MQAKNEKKAELKLNYIFNVLIKGEYLKNGHFKYFHMFLR